MLAWYGWTAAYEMAVRSWEYGDGALGREGVVPDMDMDMDIDINVVERCKRGAVANANRKRGGEGGRWRRERTFGRDEGAPEEEE